MTRRLMQGSEAIAESMVQADCRFFAGYPMTPFTEVLEHMAKLLPEVGGTCINAESELEAIGMVWGAAATGTRAATGSVGQGLSLMQESLAELCLARVPVVVINMARGQGDYFQATRGGGHGDYRHIVLAPSDAAEAVRLTQLAFYLSDYWRNPVLLMGDYYLAHVAEAVDTSTIQFGELPEKIWALDGRTGGSGEPKLISPLRDPHTREAVQDQYGQYLMRSTEHIAEMQAGVEPIVEIGFAEDAELLVVAYGTPGRYARYTVARLREEGVPVGYVRPVSLWPFPAEELLAAIGPKTRAVAVYELNAGQMIDDVRLAVLGRVPIHSIGGPSFDSAAFGIAPSLEVDLVADRIRTCLNSLTDAV